MYPWGYNPAEYSVEYWELDKPCVVGELPANGGVYYEPGNLMNLCYNNGYIGTAFWVRYCFRYN